MEKIVLAVDGSDHALRAAEMAGKLSERFDAVVDIVNVVPETRMVVPGTIQDYSRLESIYITQRDLLQSAGSDIVGRAARQVVESGGTIGEFEVIVGPPAPSIADYAESVSADCIVMGRRGLGEIKGLFMGSISQRVGHLTDITLVTTQ